MPRFLLAQPLKTTTKKIGQLQVYRIQNKIKMSTNRCIYHAEIQNAKRLAHKIIVGDVIAVPRVTISLIYIISSTSSGLTDIYYLRLKFCIII